jgi:hypothetical protein
MTKIEYPNGGAVTMSEVTLIPDPRMALAAARVSERIAVVEHLQRGGS